jgi:hypothetical protein
VCQHQFNKKQSLLNGEYFIVFPMKQQIKSVLEGCNVEKMRKPADFINAEYSFDLVSGEMLQSLYENKEISETDLTGLWNFDGVPVFSSTQFSMWPFHFTINELSYNDRKKNVLMYGMWFSTKNPRCDTFLQPLILESQALATEGLAWRNPLTGQEVISKFFFTTATCDSVAAVQW